jgi:SAM-dependent methyltransferase
MMNDEPLHEMKPLTRFTDRVADYVRFRPDYPEAAIEEMLSGLGFPALLTVADIGAGTGILSMQIAARGALVVAVEPNETMRGAIEKHDRILTQDGTAETCGLNDESINLIVCGQAFHWFDPTFALPEFRRVLKNNGRLALIWNMRDQEDPVSCGYAAALLKASQDHPAARRSVPVETLAESELFDGLRETTYPHEQRLSIEGIIGRARSASYCPPDGPAFDQLVQDLTELHSSHKDEQGLASLRYKTQLFLCERTAPEQLDLS